MIRFVDKAKVPALPPAKPKAAKITTARKAMAQVPGKRGRPKKAKMEIGKP